MGTKEEKAQPPIDSMDDVRALVVPEVPEIDRDDFNRIEPANLADKIAKHAGLYDHYTRDIPYLAKMETDLVAFRNRLEADIASELRDGKDKLTEKAIGEEVQCDDDVIEVQTVLGIVRHRIAEGERIKDLFYRRERAMQMLTELVRVGFAGPRAGRSRDEDEAPAPRGRPKGAQGRRKREPEPEPEPEENDGENGSDEPEEQEEPRRTFGRGKKKATRGKKKATRGRKREPEPEEEPEENDEEEPEEKPKGRGRGRGRPAKKKSAGRGRARARDEEDDDPDDDPPPRGRKPTTRGRTRPSERKREPEPEPEENGDEYYDDGDEYDCAAYYDGDEAEFAGYDVDPEEYEQEQEHVEPARTRTVGVGWRTSSNYNPRSKAEPIVADAPVRNVFADSENPIDENGWWLAWHDDPELRFLSDEQREYVFEQEKLAQQAYSQSLADTAAPTLAEENKRIAWLSTSGNGPWRSPSRVKEPHLAEERYAEMKEFENRYHKAWREAKERARA